MQDDKIELRNLHYLLDRELQDAANKFGTWPTDPLHCVAIIGEEFGELTQAVLDAKYADEQDAEHFAKIEMEATQTAAMCLRFLLSLYALDWSAAEQQQDAVWRLFGE